MGIEYGVGLGHADDVVLASEGIRGRVQDDCVLEVIFPGTSVVMRLVSNIDLHKRIRMMRLE